MSQLPVLQEPYDVLRNGLPAAVPALAAPPASERQLPRLSVHEMFGIGAALRMEQDAKLMENFHRFPGLPSSFLGLETETGRINDLTVGDWLGQPLEKKGMVNDFHVTMERALKM